MADISPTTNLSPLSRLVAVFAPPPPDGVVRLRAALDELAPASAALRSRLERPVGIVSAAHGNASRAD